MMRTASKATFKGLSLRIGATLALAVLGLMASAPARATTVTFAQFTQAGAGSPFVFTNNTTFGTVGIQTISTQVNFNFTTASGVSDATHSATLFLTAITNTPASSAMLGGKTYLDQPINGAGNPSSDTLTIIDNVTGQTLLSVTFTGDITGVAGGTTASLSGGTDQGNTVNYSSNYLNFGGPTAGNPNAYVLGLTSVAPVLSIGPGGFLNSFTSAFTGSFSANNVTAGAVPEPTSIAMFGTGIVATLVLASQRKRLAVLNRS